jgi:SSS family solute:Na+ symporter
MFGAVISSYTATLNSSATLFVCDIYQAYFNPTDRVKRLSVFLQIGFTLVSIALVPAYMHAESIIQLIQQLIGLFSMPILAAFITGLLFRNVEARAVIATIIFGALLYAALTFGWPVLREHYASIPKPPHFLHLMFVTVWACIGFALTVNRLIFGRRAEFELKTTESWRRLFAMMKA